MPSTMRTEFPWLSIGDLADYYEKGDPVEGEFIKSWDWMQQFYEDDSFPMKTAVLTLIAQLRMRGTTENSEQDNLFGRLSFPVRAVTDCAKTSRVFTFGFART